MKTYTKKNSNKMWGTCQHCTMVEFLPMWEIGAIGRSICSPSDSVSRKSFNSVGQGVLLGAITSVGGGGGGGSYSIPTYTFVQCIGVQVKAVQQTQSREMLVRLIKQQAADTATLSKLHHKTEHLGRQVRPCIELISLRCLFLRGNVNIRLR